MGMVTGTLSGLVEPPKRSPAMEHGMAGGPDWDDEDARLLARVAQRDVAAFEHLYNRFAGAVYSLINRITGSPHTAQDTTQEAFLSIWRNAGEFDPSRGRARSWVLSLAHHKGVDAVRRLRVRSADMLDEGVRMNPSPDPVEFAMRAVAQGQVRQALMALSREQREAIVLAYYGGYTQQEIAQRLQVPLGTVKTRVRDGMARLRGSLAESEESPR
jgi:RNA polymerase sigma-70 factor (ECF subfamily)